MLSSLLSLLIITMLGVLIFQMRGQRLATENILHDSRLRTKLFENAEESTTLILSRTLDSIASGGSAPELENDAFAMSVVRELVKRRVRKDKWMEIQNNERLIHELFLLLRERG